MNAKDLRSKKEVNEDLDEDNDFLMDDDGDETGIQDDQFLTFNLDQEVYAIDLLNVMEIIRLIHITPIPETLACVKGIINLRGKIIPVMDVRIRFKLPEKEYEERTCIIVVTINDLEMGLIVDHVDEVIEINAAQIDNMPVVSRNETQRFVRGIGKTDNGVKIILNLEKLLFDEEVEEIKKATLKQAA